MGQRPSVGRQLVDEERMRPMCFDTVGWSTGRASGPVISTDSLLNLEQLQKRRPAVQKLCVWTEGVRNMVQWLRQ